MSNLGDVYQDLFVEYKKGKKPSEAQKEFNQFWGDARKKNIPR